MSTKRYWLLAAALLVAAPGIAAAQQPQTITFDQAVDLALRQSTAILRAENQLTLDALAVQDAQMRFVPDLRLSTSGSQDLASGGAARAGGQSANARLSSSVTVFDGFGNVASLRGARLAQEAGDLDLERTRQDVVFSVISGYLTLIEAAEQVKVAQENLAAQTGREADVKVLVDGGSRPIAELYQQQSNVAAARSALVEAERARALADVALVQALRLDPAGSYAFEAPAVAAADTTKPDVPALVAQALARRPDLAALSTRENAAEQSVRAAAAARLPTVSLSAGYGTSYASGTALDVADQLDATRGGSLSLGISIPLFDGLAARRAIERAEVQVDNARLTLDEQRQQVALEVRRAALDHEAAVARLDAAAARVAAAGQALAATEARYDAGVATLFEVTQARADFVDASSTQVRARYSLLFQQRVLDYYTGAIDPDAQLGA
jgi:outer membrane protein